MTEREYKQIKVAIEAMHELNIVGYGAVVSKNNVLAILQRFLDTEEK